MVKLAKIVIVCTALYLTYWVTVAHTNTVAVDKCNEAIDAIAAAYQDAVVRCGKYGQSRELAD